ncbi:hypothetical protein [Halorubrum sp. DTA98]|uniref:hypothetical protein n=1 Tax=Halorubrum sp. DTA98 TaxID=3402163 RepID=UPI003AAD6251
MRPSPSTLEQLRHASWPVVLLFVVAVLAGIFVRAYRRGVPELGVVIVVFLVLNGGLVVLGAWAGNR